MLPVAAAAKKHGLDVVDHDTNEALKRDAAEGRRLKAAATQAKVEAAVDHAIGKGKITPGRRKHGVSLLSADPGMESVLGSIPNETAVPLSEIGHASAESDTQNLTPDQNPTWFY